MTLSTAAGGRPWRDLTISARDGLRLYSRCYPAEGAGERRPVLCLPGLTRNSRDFHDIATLLSSGDQARPVYTLDLRGRGQSQRDPNWRNYTVPIEMLDVQDLLVAEGIEKPTIIGTSRGGLVAMALAAAQPGAIGAVVLNDIGPVIEREGLTRIAAYVGSIPLPRSWQEATELVAGMSRRAFPAVPPEQWAEVARQWFNEVDGKPALAYDPGLAQSFSVADGPAPELWDLFAGLSKFPLLVLRGEKSDILSAETVAQMRSRHHDSADFTVAEQGHAPLLKDAESMAVIRRFLDDVDAGRPTGAHVKAAPA